VIGRLKLWLAGIGAVVIALLSIWFGGKKAGRDAANAEELNEYVQTRKRMDKVDGDTRHPDLREWLRDRGQR
jgi:hypothetical protein